MSYGLLVNNDNNIIQISEELATHVVASSGTLTSGTYVSENGVTRYEWALTLPYSLQNKDCLVWARPAVTPSSTQHPIFSTKINPATNTTFAVRSRLNVSVDYMVTSPSWNVPEGSGGYGLKVFTATGSLVFSSNQALVQVINSAFIDPDVGAPPPAQYLGNIYSSASTWASYYALLNPAIATRSEGDKGGGSAAAGPTYVFWKDGTTYKVDLYSDWIDTPSALTQLYNGNNRWFAIAQKGV